MARGAERAQRLAARRKAKALLGPLRSLVALLANWDNEDGVDVIGVVEISPRTSEVDYAADVLDIVSQAVDEAGESQAVEIYVITTANSIHSAEAHRSESCPPQGSTQTSGQRPASRAPSSSAASRTTRGS